MAKDVQLSGNNIKGVSGARHGAQQNAGAMQRAASKAGQYKFEFGSFGSTSGTNGSTAGVKLSGNNITGVSGAQHGAQRNAESMQRAAQKSGQ